MGTCYDMVSDSKMESFDLGKTYLPWYDLKDFRPSSHIELRKWMLESYNDRHEDTKTFEDELYVIELSNKIWDFMESHKDWKIVSDDANDYVTYDSIEEMNNDKYDWGKDWPKYIEVGSRFIKE